MSSTVTVGGLEVTSNSDSSASMVESLTPAKENAAEPRVLVDEGKPVEQEKDDEGAGGTGLSDAASKLGKKGGEASAAKKAADAKEAEKAEKEEAAKDAEAEKLGKPRHDPKARMLEATRKEAEAKRELERERQERVRERAEMAAEVERLRTAKPTEKPAEAPKPKADEKPQEADFDTYPEFIEASARFAARQEWDQRQKEASQNAARAARSNAVNETMHSFQERVAEASKADAAFIERTSDLAATLQPLFLLPPGQVPRMSNFLASEIISSEQGPALMLHFSDHPEDFQRVVSLETPRDIAREVAKLEAKMEKSDAASTATAPRTEVSKARPPVRPVAGAPPTAEPDIYGEMPFETFVERKRAISR